MLLVTGASGAGKSTVLGGLARGLQTQPIRCAEFDSVAVPPRIVRSTGADGTVWRHNTVEHWVERAVKEQGCGRHLLLFGQVPVGELLAAPSAELLAGVAACVLYCSREVRRERLVARGEDPDMLEAHLAFGEWFLGHMTDPTHMPEVIRVDGATAAMRWERWQHWKHGDPRWRFEVIDADSLTLARTGELVLAWATRALAGRGGSLSGSWWRG
jgi:hypothetical protein